MQEGGAGSLILGCSSCLDLAAGKSEKYNIQHNNNNIHHTRARVENPSVSGGETYPTHKRARPNTKGLGPTQSAFLLPAQYALGFFRGHVDHPCARVDFPPDSHTDDGFVRAQIRVFYVDAVCSLVPVRRPVSTHRYITVHYAMLVANATNKLHDVVICSGWLEG